MPGEEAHINEGDIIVTTEYEHHSNIVPWQLLVKERGANFAYIDIDENGSILDQLDEHLATGKVKLVTFSLMSNVLEQFLMQNNNFKCKQAGVLPIDGHKQSSHACDLENLGVISLPSLDTKC